MTKKRRRSRRVNLSNLVMMVVIGFMLVGLIGAGGIILLQGVSGSSMNTSANKKEAEVVRSKEKDVHVAVFYPKFEENTNIQAVAKAKADELLNTLVQENQDYKKEKKAMTVKADYVETKTANRYLSIDYVITKDKEGEKTESASSYLIDLESNQLVDSLAAFDQEALDLLSANLRKEMKSQDATKEEAYSVNFINASSSKPENFKSFSIQDGTLTFSFLAGTLLTDPVEWKFPIDQLGEHFLLNVGQGNLEVGKVHPLPRVIDPNRPMVALTFDDGPHPKNTPKILDILKTNDAAATFFMQGMRVERYPETTLMVANAGSEIASHSYNHPKLPKLKDDELQYQLNRTTEIVSEMTEGAVTINLYRPPYGALNDNVKAASAYPFIMWNIDTLDWKTRDPQVTYDNVMAEVSDGSIILMHDIHEETIAAVEKVVPALIEQGYQLVTVDEMMAAKGVEMSNGSKVFSATSIK